MKRVVWLAFSLLPLLAAAVYLGGLPETGRLADAAPPLSLEGYLDEVLPAIAASVLALVVVSLLTQKSNSSQISVSKD